MFTEVLAIAWIAFFRESNKRNEKVCILGNNTSGAGLEVGRKVVRWFYKTQVRREFQGRNGTRISNYTEKGA